MKLFKQKICEPVIIGTFYTNDYGLKTIGELVRKKLPKAKITETQTDNDQKIEIFIKNGLFESATKITLNYIEKKKIYPIKKHDRNVKPTLEDEDCEASRNILGMMYFVSDYMNFSNKTLKDLFLYKISFTNSYFSFILEGEQKQNLKDLILFLSSELRAFIYANSNTFLNDDDTPRFLDQDLKTIIDPFGNSEIETIICAVKKEVEEEEGFNSSHTQKIQRKERSERTLEENNIIINPYLPCVEAECDVTLRTPREIATRISVLTALYLISINNIEAQKIIDYLKQYHLWACVTEREKAFLENLTDDAKCSITWEIEKIYVLMWAIQKVKEINFPNELCNLNQMESLIHMVNACTDPSDFINSFTSTRSKSEILDMNDLYYRFNWACVDARINGKEISELHSSVVYMRQYTLNWLINYGNQDWDNVTCDT